MELTTVALRAFTPKAVPRFVTEPCLTLVQDPPVLPVTIESWTVIEPLRLSFTVRCPATLAFEVWTRRIGQWWPLDHTVSGGEKLELAGLEFEVLLTPGHSPGHVTYALPGEEALFSGDVLFQGSVGRVDLPGGDWPTLLGSIENLLDTYPPETTVYPGHMGVTTLGRERATNPFLRELAANR